MGIHKFVSRILCISALSLFVVGETMATTLNEFDKSNGQTVHFGGTKVRSVKTGNKTKRDGLSFYSGNVEIEIEIKPEGKPAYTKKVDIWFDKKSEAMLFEAVMNNDKNLDLYYNFSRNPFNWTAYSTSCRILGSFLCHDSPVTWVDFNNIDGNKLWIHNKDTGRMTEASEAQNAHEVAELEPGVHDGNRDDSNKNAIQDQSSEGQSTQAISV